MNITTFRKLKIGDQIIHNILGSNHTVSKIEDNKVYTKSLYCEIEMIIEEGERSFFSLIK